MRLSVRSAILLALTLSRTAAAQDAPAARPGVVDELTTLEHQLALASAALSAGGCAVACPALASMGRAAERICALDPGSRCTDARAKVRDAARRVREACPECHIGPVEAPGPVQADQPAQTAQTAQPRPPPSPSPTVAFEAGSRHGGCAGCVVGGELSSSGAGALAALCALMAITRRRLRSRRP